MTLMLKICCPILVPRPCSIARRAENYTCYLNNLQLQRYDHVGHMHSVSETTTNGIKMFLWSTCDT